jgi:signal transduction histidine kinase
MSPAYPQVKGDIMRPVWIDGELVLLRRVTVNDEKYIQGCLLDWEALSGNLLGNIAGIFSQAGLEPQPGPAGTGEHLMAALPVRLTAEYDLPDDIGVSSPVRTALVLAWIGVIIAGIAVAFLLQGTVTLSERRGAFVSAVTHELRTPLTTFRMYSEMLAEGMIQDETKRGNYLKRLCTEADRLTHLVENVLSFAQLEKGRPAHHLENINVFNLLDRIKHRLEDRAEQVGMTLTIPAGAEPLPVHADITAVEQILFNLVDNASKYASAGDNSAVTIEVDSGPAGVAVRVCDNGPGINPEEESRLFKPFRKSARDAAHSAPGVGLGLALSRRLARGMRGDLTADTRVEKGACFVLTLPHAER